MTDLTLQARLAQMLYRIADRVTDEPLAQEIRQAATAYEQDYEAGIAVTMFRMGMLSIDIIVYSLSMLGGNIEGIDDLKAAVNQSNAAIMNWLNSHRRQQNVTLIVGVILLLCAILNLLTQVAIVALLWILVRQA